MIAQNGELRKGQRAQSRQRGQNPFFTTHDHNFWGDYPFDTSPEIAIWEQQFNLKPFRSEYQIKLVEVVASLVDFTVWYDGA